jgi:hypothetical protein
MAPQITYADSITAVSLETANNASGIEVQGAHSTVLPRVPSLHSNSVSIDCGR